MKRHFAFLSFIAIITLISCGEQNKSAGGQTDAGDNSFKLLDSSYSAYQVVMTGYDTTQFNQYYEKRISPPVINLNQSLEDKSISELYLLKNTLLAMKGQSFQEAMLATYFRKFPWYQPPFWNEQFTIKLIESEQSFINRINQKIDQLWEVNYLPSNKINVNNAINLFQYESLPDDVWEKINDNGFVLLQDPSNQPTDLYIDNLEKSIPPFITTDLMLHQMHLFYGILENEIEEIFLTDILKSMLEIINVELYSSYEKTLDSLIEKTIEESLLYYSIPYGIITGNKTNLIGNYNRIYYEELGKVLDGEGIGSKVIKSDKFNYRIFKPYGHYGKNELITSYYKALTWLQKISLCLNDDEEFSRAILIAYIINQSADLRNSYEEYMEVKTYFSSQRDQFTFWDLAKVMNQVEGIHVFEDLFKPKTLQQVKDLLNLKESETCQIRVSLMPVEYQNLYTDLSQIIKDDDNPSPLQLFAALGNGTASEMLNAPTNSSSIMENLLKISTQEEARSMDWLSTLLTSLHDASNTPKFMQQTPWKRKNLNAALGSWIQLNERVSVQARRSDKVIEDIDSDLVLKGYVEPNIAFWNASSILLQNTSSFLSDKQMLSSNSRNIIDHLLSTITFLKSMSEKQLHHEPLTGEEFKRIKSIGTKLQDLTFKMLNNSYRSGNHEISNSMAYVTNIHNGDHHLLAGVGPAHTLLAPVEINGYVYITRGMIYSFYELNDYPQANIRQKDWEQMAKIPKRDEIIPWMKDYYAADRPLDETIIASN